MKLSKTKPLLCTELIFILKFSSEVLSSNRHGEQTQSTETFWAFYNRWVKQIFWGAGLILPVYLSLGILYSC